MRGGPSIIGRAGRLRRDTTDAERMLWAELRHHQRGWRFRRQHPMLPYIVDFACIDARLVVEADGGQHERVGEHEARDRALRLNGWRVLRFWNNDIVENRPGVLQSIAAALGPHPDGGPP